MCERGRDGVMFLCGHVYNATLCGNIVKSWLLVSDWLANPSLELACISASCIGKKGKRSSATALHY